MLIIQVDKTNIISVGALGSLFFKKGLYAYIGSAQTTLESRIKRHLRRKKRNFWHIDYLLSNSSVKIENIYFKQTKKSDECKMAQSIGEIGRPIIGFGCSDCNCKSHLFRISNHSLPLDTMQVFSTET